jgi:hypothetical protein
VSHPLSWSGVSSASRRVAERGDEDHRNQAALLHGDWTPPALGKVTVAAWAQRWAASNAALKPSAKAFL